MTARVARVVQHAWMRLRTAATGLRDEVDDRFDPLKGQPAHAASQAGPADHRLCGDS